MDLKEETKLLLKEEVFQIVGAAIEILNHVGMVSMKSPMKMHLLSNFGLRSISFQQQKSFDLLYKNCKVGQFIPDLIAFNTVIVDTKTIDRITDFERGQMLNYLRITKFRVGVILNFKNPRLEWERIVL